MKTGATVGGDENAADTMIATALRHRKYISGIVDPRSLLILINRPSVSLGPTRHMANRETGGNDQCSG